MKTVIFGGSFNPPHIGHYEMVKLLEEREDVEKILIIPNKAPVHKVGFGFADNSERLNMALLLASDFKKAEVLDIELERDEKSYSYLTLLELTKRSPEKDFWFLCGADMLVTLKTWYEYKKLIKLCGFLAVFRKGEDRERFDNAVKELTLDGARIETISAEISEVSSTEVRIKISEEGSIEDIVPQKIASYIKKRKIYKEEQGLDIEKLKKHISDRLTEKRFHHSLCVADEAVRLADRYGANKEKAYLAGLLHDVLKDTSCNEQLKFAKEFGIILSDLEFSAPKLYHSLIGCEYVKNILGIDDEEIYGAIKYHTTARAGMTLLEKVIYLADYTSLDRDYNGVDMMREAVDKGLRIALKEALDFTVSDLKSRSVPIHPDTLAAWQEYSEEN